MKHPLDPADAPLVSELIAPYIDSKDKGADECWYWNGGGDRYGRIAFKGHLYGSHVLSLFAEQGWIDPTLMVLHKCHCSRCNRPSHLYQGTAKQNTKDIHDANRGCYGARNHLTRYPAHLVAEIRRRYKAGERGVDLQKEFHLSRNIVYMWAKDQRRAHDGH